MSLDDEERGAVVRIAGVWTPGASTLPTTPALAIQERRHSCNANRWRFKSVDTPDNANRWRSESVDALDNANRWRSESVDTPDNANRWRSESVDAPDNANGWRSKSVDALIDVQGTDPGAFTELAGDAWVLRLRHGHVLSVSSDSQ